MNEFSPLTGWHHVTAITANASANLDFYTRVLGLRLVKKTVNQDDVTAYHLFYADGRGSPGTDLTFFDWPAVPEQRGADSITRTGLRVAGAETVEWWKARLEEAGVTMGAVHERDGRTVLDFEDPEGQRLCIIDDDGHGESSPWEKSPVPEAHQIRGLGPVVITVSRPEPTMGVLAGLMGFEKIRGYDWKEAGQEQAFPVHVFQMGGSGPQAELHLRVEPESPRSRSGAGGVHHVAFRTPDEAGYEFWRERLARSGIPSSGPVDRFYFRSLYFREPNGVLFEIATDGPGFATDEPMEQLGEGLALPPFLEPRRAQIEAGLKPL